MEDPYAVAEMDGVSKSWYPALAWRGVLKCMAQAEDAIKAGDIPVRHACLMRAQNLVAILDHAFQDTAAPTLAEPLHKSHQHVLNYLARANMQNSVEAIEAARTIALAFEETWTRAVAQTTGLIHQEA